MMINGKAPAFITGEPSRMLAVVRVGQSSGARMYAWASCCRSASSDSKPDGSGTTLVEVVAGYHISTLNVRDLCESLSSMVTLPTPKVPIESGGDKEAGLSDVFVIEQPAKRNASARSVFGV